MLLNASRSFFRAPGGSGTPPDTFDSVAYAIGVDSDSYLLGWPAAAGAVSYSYAINGGSYTTRGTEQWAMVTGRTPSATDSVVVRAYSVSGLSADMPVSVTLAAGGTADTVFSVIGTGTNPFGGACDYSAPHAWTTAGTTINGGNGSLVSTNKKLIGLMLAEEWLNAPVVFGDGTSAGLGNNIMTTSATCHRRLNVFPGHSFCDHVDRCASNELRYDPANGAAMKYGSSTSNPIIDLREAHSGCERIQLSSVGNGTSTWGGWGIHSSSPSAPVYSDRMLVESGTNQFVYSFNYHAHIVSNCIDAGNHR